jgi:hypothetical protein
MIVVDFEQQLGHPEVEETLLEIFLVVVRYMSQVRPLLGWAVVIERDEGCEDVIDKLTWQCWELRHCW